MLNNKEKSIAVLMEDLGMLYPRSTSKQKTRFGIFKCVCGNNFKASMSNVKNKAFVSCGCYKKQKNIELRYKHGMSGHKIYAVWIAVIQRCTNINATFYENYGGRGIKVCDRWRHSFENFRDDMLPTWEKGLSIDRIDNNGNYEPSNCRWTDENTQHRNTRRIMSTNTTGYRGVSFVKASKKWTSQIGIKDTKKHLGTFNTALEAAIAYDSFIIDNNLEHTKNGVI